MNISLGITGGIYNVEDVIKALMAGAHGVQIVSSLLQKGPEHLKQLLEQLANWLERHGYKSIDQMRGSINLEHAEDPSAIERVNYIRVLQGGPA